MRRRSTTASPETAGTTQRVTTPSCRSSTPRVGTGTTSTTCTPPCATQRRRFAGCEAARTPSASTREGSPSPDRPPGPRASWYGAAASERPRPRRRRRAPSQAVVAADEYDFKDEELAADPTLASTHLGESSAVQAAVSQWGAGYGVEVLEWADGIPRITAASPPILALAGTNDTVIVPENSEWLCARYAAVNATCELVLLRGAGHGAWNATLDGGEESQNHHAFAFLSSHLLPQA